MTVAQDSGVRDRCPPVKSVRPHRPRRATVSASSPATATLPTTADAIGVRRIDTAGGGEPEDGCDPQHQGDIARIRYSAVYQFYGE